MMTEIDLGTERVGYTNSAFTLENGHQNNGSTNPPQNPVKENSLVTNDKDEEDEGCGWYFCKSRWLRSFKNPKCLLFWLCWAAAVQGMAVNGFVNVSISTIEKRYHLRSSTTGLIAGFYDIACLLCLIPVSYLGSRPNASKPRWLGWGVLIMGCGSFVFSIPHFAGPLYDPVHIATNINATSVCVAKTGDTMEDFCQLEGDNWLQSFKYVFMLGSFLHGVGSTPLYTLGIAYLDESVPVKMSSMYLGIYHTMAVVGPAFGYVIGGQFLSVFIDSPTSDPESLGVDRDGNLWLGAWWVGFLIAGSLAVMVSWIILSFPDQLEGFKERAKVRAALAIESAPSTQGFGNLKALPQESKVLLSNIPYIFVSCAETVEGFMMSGFASFVPKIIESQFSVSSGFAAILVGCMAVPAGGGGTFIGGWLVKRYQLGCRDIMKMCSIFSIICCVFCSSYFLSCPNKVFAGVTVPYSQSSSNNSKWSLSSSCNSDCSCNELTYDPVCGSDNIIYFSPCHAGCNSSMTNGGQEVFHDCGCISTASRQQSAMEDSHVLPEFSATRESCDTSCDLLPYFLVLFFLTMFFIFLVTMPSVSATLRSVPDTHRSLALGLQWIGIRVFGTIPGPIIFGIILDSTCNLWQTTCDGSGACRNYDNLQMSRSVLGLAVGLRVLTTIFYMLAWWFFREKPKTSPS